MKKISLLLLLGISFFSFSQENIGYQEPPKEILNLADAPSTPRIRMSDNAENIVFLYANNYKSIETLSEKEMRLGGLRINPKTNINSRQSYYNDIKVRIGRKGIESTVTGLPAKGRFANFSWSPDQQKMAFTNTTTTGVELWIIDINAKKAKKLTSATLNANMGRPFSWFKDSNSLLVKFISKERKELIDTKTSIPSGPTISVNQKGKKAQNRTYQDLLKNKTDEHNFEQLALSELQKVDLEGNKSSWMKDDMYRNVSFSPDGNYIMITIIQKPFSYLVPYYRFPAKTNIYDTNANLITTALEVPLIEDLPKGFMAVRKGKRNLSWRRDKPSTIFWAEALDEGNPENEVPYRDEVFELEAPFNGKANSLIKTIGRFSTINWGNNNAAIAEDYWWNTRNTKSYFFNPSKNSIKPITIYDRNYQDRYSDPGSFVTKRNEYGQYTLEIVDNNVFLIGDGYSKKGKFPFVDKLNLKTQKTSRLYQSKLTDKVESIVTSLDMKKGEIIVGIESKSEFPNYFVRNIKKKSTPITPLTTFENPFKSLQNIYKKVIKYKREDGLELSGTLYLPSNYEKGKKYPMIMWAYPREFKDKSSAGQSTSSSNEFTYPWYGSPIYWVTRGYVVLDDASFPIVGEGKEEPNDTFIKQLVGNAKAAIDAVDELGYIDRNKVAVGGHSYGAFMTANLLSHSNLFAAGIARSGAYNRTLTPFGFQSEERNYWEAPEVYYNMSPFMHADKMKTPLLLIHGEADNNSGTYPLQSERYFNALKGLGAPVRLVMLPKESHGYRAKESIMHMLWEQDQWLEKHVKNRKTN
ncbi:dipeptidyl aminopeptidase/acylaminoacyl peptidase [Tenacibaculum lutimaris]|uniref:Dipeptidyl aminopeptidase/acylaminoacyl peptidase n=1 Tax=Tenacibaculum lutimaris TaxID=285258 RepID=A0A420E0B4_9FLAO|nr:prolyl oligopeptidase family serine peptidase [Tenacibaculum lutimaris]RKF03519.1 dipeptidyl aminopeptidase/acylaminoacyl peptidase [Tenacibaculum lutimaris]